MTLDELYDFSAAIADVKTQIFGESQLGVEIVLTLNKGDLSDIDKKLYEETHGELNGFKHTNVVTATINGVKFNLVEE